MLLQPTTAQRPIPPMRWAKPTPCDLQRWIDLCLQNQGETVYSAHASRDRLRQRGLTPDDVDAIIATGYPYRADAGSMPGEWKVNISKTMPCGRDAAAVCLVSKNTWAITILTVMWVDRSYNRDR